MPQHALRDPGNVMLRCFPRVDAIGLWLMCRGRLCEDIVCGHDSRGEVSRGALDTEDGSVRCVSFMAGRGECICIHNG